MITQHFKITMKKKNSKAKTAKLIFRYFTISSFDFNNVVNECDLFVSQFKEKFHKTYKVVKVDNIPGPGQ